MVAVHDKAVVRKKVHISSSIDNFGFCYTYEFFEVIPVKFNAVGASSLAAAAVEPALIMGTSAIKHSSLNGNIEF